MIFPSNYQELERIYQRLQLSSSSCIAVTSAMPGEGVSLLVDALANRALKAHKKVLVVDFNLFHPRDVAPVQSGSEEHILQWRKGVPHSANTNRKAQLGCSDKLTDSSVLEPKGQMTIMPTPMDKESIVALREPGALEACIQQWKKDYQLIIFDCAAVNLNNRGNLPASRVVAASDGVIMCYMAGITAAIHLRQAHEELQREEALLLGVVINDQYNPLLKQELLRKLRKWSAKLPRLNAWLHRKIQNSQLLSIRT
ncbi:tyrosine-protein kinase family protein [Echinimonas agarilytica]|uniref:Uncharacterized protein n=1 Tax=Echinimonas agarilytica TaxID=1215918 RepID=A0AA41W6I8_9GAMM|nr:hypothetical protein [Echinimonas agarilytica]MCM2679546.1 hypothetical protein [Echinimonas agarilytica]